MRMFVVGAPQEGLVEFFLASVIFLLSRIERLDSSPVPLALDIVVAAGAAVSGRWATPGAIVAGVGATAWLFFPWERPTLGLVASLVPLFAVVSRGHTRTAIGLTAWYTPVLLVVVSEWGSKGVAGVLFNAGFTVLLVATVWAIGWLIHWKDAKIAAVTKGFERRVLDQRRDLARDLHDTLAQTVTGMVVTAEIARRRHEGACPIDIQDDLSTVVRLGQQAISDVRGMMRVLRTADPGEQFPALWAARPVSQELAEQAAELERRGFSVSTLVDGDPEGLPPSVRACLSKLIVEGAANIAKHSVPGGHCSLMIEVTDKGAEVMFSNPCGPDDSTADFVHLGLLGANERVEALGGQLRAHRSGSQWILRARVPIAGYDDSVTR